MSNKFKILAEFVKDSSCETPDVETYLYVKEYLKNYNLSIDITTKPLKNNCRVQGKIIKSPIVSVKKPGKIIKIAANANAAPETIS